MIWANMINRYMATHISPKWPPPPGYMCTFCPTVTPLKWEHTWKACISFVLLKYYLSKHASCARNWEKYVQIISENTIHVYHMAWLLGQIFKSNKLWRNIQRPEHEHDESKLKYISGNPSGGGGKGRYIFVILCDSWQHTYIFHLSLWVQFLTLHQAPLSKFGHYWKTILFYGRLISHFLAIKEFFKPYFLPRKMDGNQEMWLNISGSNNIKYIQGGCCNFLHGCPFSCVCFLISTVICLPLCISTFV